MDIEALIKKCSAHEQLTDSEMDEINEWLYVPFMTKHEGDEFTIGVVPIGELLAKFLIARTLINIFNTKPDDLIKMVEAMRLG